MGQKLYEDKIGSLSYGGGIVTLAPSRLTIGGQQYITSSLQLTIPTLTANTLYMIYAVVSGGTVSLVQSTNVNSLGPAGQTSWKLVGAYYANGMSPVAFGSFVTIEGAPQTMNRIPFLSTLNSNTNVSGQQFMWERDGGKIFSYGRVNYSGVGAATTFSSTLAINIDPAQIPGTVPGLDQNFGYWGWYDNSGAQGRGGFVHTFNAASNIALNDSNSSNDWASNQANTSDVISWTIQYPGVNLTSTPLKDL